MGLIPILLLIEKSLRESFLDKTIAGTKLGAVHWLV